MVGSRPAETSRCEMVAGRRPPTGLLPPDTSSDSNYDIVDFNIDTEPYIALDLFKESTSDQHCHALDLFSNGDGCGDKDPRYHPDYSLDPFSNGPRHDKRSVRDHAYDVLLDLLDHEPGYYPIGHVIGGSGYQTYFTLDLFSNGHSYDKSISRYQTDFALDIFSNGPSYDKGRSKYQAYIDLGLFNNGPSYDKGRSRYQVNVVLDPFEKEWPFTSEPIDHDYKHHANESTACAMFTRGLSHAHGVHTQSKSSINAGRTDSRCSHAITGGYLHPWH